MQSVWRKRHLVFYKRDICFSQNKYFPWASTLGYGEPKREEMDCKVLPAYLLSCMRRACSGPTLYITCNNTATFNTASNNGIINHLYSHPITCTTTNGLQTCFVLSQITGEALSSGLRFNQFLLFYFCQVLDLLLTLGG